MANPLLDILWGAIANPERITPLIETMGRRINPGAYGTYGDRGDPITDGFGSPTLDWLESLPDRGQPALPLGLRSMPAAAPPVAPAEGQLRAIQTLRGTRPGVAVSFGANERPAEFLAPHWQHAGMGRHVL